MRCGPTSDIFKQSRVQRGDAMATRFRPWWRRASSHPKTIALIVLMGIFVLIFLGYFLDWGWTGFKGKTLWEWLNLLGVLAIPAVVGLGAAWYTAQQAKVSAMENTDNQREAAFQGYLDKMSDLLLQEHLRTSPPDSEVRSIARARTLAIFPQLDDIRKRRLLRFLYESDLIKKDTGKEILDLNGLSLYELSLVGIDMRKIDLSGVSLRDDDLSEANLSGADLSHAIILRAILIKTNLSEADLSHTLLCEADLSEADLSHALLCGADLRSANLSGAILSEATLDGADLREAIVTSEQLQTARSLKGAILPDGSPHS